ncbi:hypothetical protein N8T08_000731 [Aspergillus melleus]|uniref:Uncharacterized protein n=1 Tax=Aspergillus melleus TaxID=138277 RepID=A0ACC3APA0_9EURO|nr:hypothetical protein N8T08_000731 [Aspergillus melleus]
MRATQLLALSGLMLASKVAVAAELDRDDVPNRCWDVCGPVVGTAHRCDGMHDRDRAEMDCICDWNQAPSLVPLCEACIADYRADRNNTNRDRHYDEEHDLFDDDDDDDDDDDRDDRDPHHNDAYDILRSCSFSTTSYNAAAATSALSNTASATGSSSSSGSKTGSTTVSATSTDSSSNGGSGGSSSAADSSTTGSADSAQTTDNAAPGSSASQAASLAAIVGLGFVAML